MISRLHVTCLLMSCLAIILIAPVGVAAENAAPKDVATAVTPKDGPIRLLNGKDLDNCYTWLKDTQLEDPRRVFRVEDGILHITGDGLGSVITKDSYRDFHAIVEFKWGDKTWRTREDSARDSGFLIHSHGADGGYSGTWMPSVEVQIIEGGVGDFILVNGVDKNKQPLDISLTSEVDRDRDGEVIWKAGGKRETFNRSNRKRINWFGRDPNWKDEKGFRGAHDKDSPHGEWTRLDVFCDGGHVEVFVNGTKVNEAFDVSPHEGRLQLQTELAEVFYRRWELWPLGNGPEPAPAK